MESFRSHQSLPKPRMHFIGEVYLVSEVGDANDDVRCMSPGSPVFHTVESVKSPLNLKVPKLPVQILKYPC